MFFSIIIPTCNRNDLLAVCLDKLSLEVQQLKQEQYEVIVTDDGSNNEAKTLVDANYPWVKWQEGPKKGPAANRNSGARIAAGKWLIFFDDDCIPDKAILSNYYNAIHAASGMLVFEGRISADRPKQRLDEEAPLNETGGLLWSCNFMIAKQLFMEKNGFNEAFIYASMEDVDLRERLCKTNKIVFVEKAFVIHPWRIVSNPGLKFKRVLLAHKTYITIDYNKNYFDPIMVFRRMISGLIRVTIPDLFRYRAKGWKYPLQFHLFQLRLLCFVFKSR